MLGDAWLGILPAKFIRIRPPPPTSSHPLSFLSSAPMSKRKKVPDAHVSDSTAARTAVGDRPPPLLPSLNLSNSETTVKTVVAALLTLLPHGATGQDAAAKKLMRAISLLMAELDARSRAMAIANESEGTRLPIAFRFPSGDTAGNNDDDDESGRGGGAVGIRVGGDDDDNSTWTKLGDEWYVCVVGGGSCGPIVIPTLFFPRTRTGAGSAGDATHHIINSSRDHLPRTPPLIFVPIRLLRLSKSSTTASASAFFPPRRLPYLLRRRRCHRRPRRGRSRSPRKP